MKNKQLYSIWSLLYILCVVLGFIRREGSGWNWVFTAVSLGFFVPPAVLLHRGMKAGDRFTVKLVRYLSLASLVLTAALLVLNFLSVLGSEALGTFLHGIMIFVSVPMVSSGYWFLAIFCWAFLLMGSFKKITA